MTTWKDWKGKYPDSTVLNLPRTASSFVRDIMDHKNVYAYGIKVGTETAAYSYATLFKQPLLEDELAGTTVVLVFDADSTRTFAFDRMLENKQLSFELELQNGSLLDKETGSLWDPWSGVSTSGTHEGKQLKPIYGLITYIKSWKQFYPESRLVFQ